MPGGVNDLLVKVQTVDADFVFFAFAAGANFARLEDGPRLHVLATRLQRGVALAVAVEHAEKIVVRARHDVPGTDIRDEVSRREFAGKLKNEKN